jgi:hypothetical protein
VRDGNGQRTVIYQAPEGVDELPDPCAPDSEPLNQRTEFYQAPEECADLPDPCAPSDPAPPMPATATELEAAKRERATTTPLQAIDDDDDDNPGTVPMHPVDARAFLEREFPPPASTTDRIVVRVDDVDDSEARTMLFEASDSQPGQPYRPELDSGVDRTEHLQSDDLLERLLEGVASERPPPPAPPPPAPWPHPAPWPTTTAAPQHAQQSSADATVARPSLHFAPEGPGARELARVRWVFIAAVVLVTLLALVGVLLARGRGA